MNCVSKKATCQRTVHIQLNVTGAKNGIILCMSIHFRMARSMFIKTQSALKFMARKASKKCAKIVVIYSFSKKFDEKIKVHVITDDQSNRSLTSPQLQDKLNLDIVVTQGKMVAGLIITVIIKY